MQQLVQSHVLSKGQTKIGVPTQLGLEPAELIWRDGLVAIIFDPSLM
jgi:hypothetical protein